MEEAKVEAYAEFQAYQRGKQEFQKLKPPPSPSPRPESNLEGED